MTKDIVQARTWQLLNILADGEFHSGEVLAGRLGVSRGRGYRLAQPWQRLEREEILRWLGEDVGQFDIGILPQAASSNTLLLQRAGPGAANGGDRKSTRLNSSH